MNGVRRGWFAAVFAGFVFVAACTSSNSSSSAERTTDTSKVVTDSGTLVIGAEQEPACADWISQCAGAVWGIWTMQEHTMPRAFDPVQIDGTWQYLPSILLVGEPTVELDDAGAQRVTYRINPEAVWSDGEPITSDDFAYTWEEIATGDDVFDPTGYDQIKGIDTSDPKTAVVTFEEGQPFGSWKQLFGADYGVFPSHILEGKNRNRQMKDGYDWSGGPWKIESWDRGVAVTLVPNDAYWGTQPQIDKVVFRFIESTAPLFKAFETGEVDAIYPQSEPAAITLIDDGVSGGQSLFTAETGNIEALWMNNARAPLDSVAVRQAIAYSIDRTAIVQRLFGALGVDEPMQTLNPPILSAFADTEAWAEYVPDLARVDALLTGDGWAKGSDGIYAKDGDKLSLTIVTDIGNQRRELTEEILQAQLEEAGIKLVIKNEKPDQFFGQTLYGGEYQLALVANVTTTLEPDLCAIMCSSNIPSEDNDFSGDNFTAANVPEADTLMEIVESSTDETLRASSQKEADRLLAAAQVSLPLDPLPNIALWSDRIVADISDNPILAMFWNMNTWRLEG